MAWGDFLSKSFADKLDDAGKVLMLVAWVVGAAGLFSGFTPLLAGAAAIGFAGLVVPPVYAVIECIARNVAAWVVGESPVPESEQPQATIEKPKPRLKAECESDRYQELVTLRQKLASHYRNT